MVDILFCKSGVKPVASWMKERRRFYYGHCYFFFSFLNAYLIHRAILESENDVFGTAK